MQATGAASGVAVVMHTGTGELLALASVDADPTTGAVATSSRARAVTDSYEPGSVNKPFTMAAALEERVVAPDEVIDVPRQYTFSDKTFVEPFADLDRRLTPGEILRAPPTSARSASPSACTAPLLHDYLQAFGFGSRTGPDGAALLGGEQTGVLRPVEEWRGVTMATIAIGQGISVTPLQLATAYNTIANGGEYVAPSIVRGTEDGGGASPRRRPRSAIASSRRDRGDVDGDAAAVVEGDTGTGGRAAVPGYQVAGKTGTAQKVSETGGYSPSEYVATFAGFVPAEDPQLSIVVALDEPTVGHLAGRSPRPSSPIWPGIRSAACASHRIPPSSPSTVLLSELLDRAELRSATVVRPPGRAGVDGRDVDVGDVTNDSRQVGAGSLFVCVRGRTVDGHVLAADAVAAGAVGLLVGHVVDADVPQVVVDDPRAAMGPLAAGCGATRAGTSSSSG